MAQKEPIQTRPCVYERDKSSIIDLLNAKRRPDGLWPLEHKYAAKVFFNMERVGKPSRWVTLRALRVLRWWDS